MPGQPALRQAQHAQRVGRIVLVGCQNLGAHFIRQRLFAPAQHDAGAKLQDFARRALYNGQLAVRALMHSAHALAARIEGQLVQARELREHVGREQPALDCHRQQRGLGLVAQAVP